MSRTLCDAAALCQTMTAELLALASCRSSAATVLAAVDPHQTELLDLLIQLRHKEVSTLVSRGFIAGLGTGWCELCVC